MTEIRKHGAILATDDDGYLIPDASLDKIVPPWDAAVDFIKEAYIEHLGDRLHSVYVRGSVARGLAVEGISDLDSVALVHGNPPQARERLSWAGEVREKYLKRFPFSDRPEIWIDWVGPLLDNLEDKGMSLKLEYVCVHGEDVVARIPPVQLKALAKKVKLRREYIESIVGEVREDVAKSEHPEFVKKECKWICKRFLRAGSRLVIARTQKYTRDLYYCYELFSNVYPQQEPLMRRALELALNPTTDANELIPLVDELGAFLAQEADVDYLRR